MQFLQTNSEPPTDVLVLTADNFKQALEEHSDLVVEFYAPWCGHCQSLAPTYEKIATHYNTDPASKITIAKIDAATFEKIALEYNVEVSLVVLIRCLLYFLLPNGLIYTNHQNILHTFLYQKIETLLNTT